MIYNHYIIEYISDHTKTFGVGEMHALIGTVLALQVQGHDSEKKKARRSGMCMYFNPGTGETETGGSLKSGSLACLVNSSLERSGSYGQHLSDHTQVCPVSSIYTCFWMRTSTRTREKPDSLLALPYFI